MFLTILWDGFIMNFKEKELGQRILAQKQKIQKLKEAISSSKKLIAQQQEKNEEDKCEEE